MPKNDEQLSPEGQGHVLVRMAYQSPIDAHWETLEISVPPTSSDQYINDAFTVYGKVRKIMAKTIVEMLTADDNPRIDQAAPQPERAPYPQHTSQANGGNSNSRQPKVVYVEGKPFETKIFFGKHNGKSLAWIETRDDSYIDWLYDNTQQEQLKSDCNVIITMRGSDEHYAILNPSPVTPVATDDVSEEEAEEDEPFDDQIDADLFPSN